MLHIMKRRIAPVLCFITIVFCSCISLQKPTATFHSSLEGYKYVYITPTTPVQSVVGATFGGSYGIYGGTDTYSVNPADIIAGFFIKRGFIVVPEIKSENADQTIVINYGEEKSGQTTMSIFHIVGVVIQIISAATNDVICICTGEGSSETDTGAVTQAINRSMEELFKHYQ